MLPKPWPVAMMTGLLWLPVLATLRLQQAVAKTGG
jgi:hypothetical protein